jgi:4-hydroxy-3-polyprenylbenzoate decarboxylase
MPVTIAIGNDPIIPITAASNFEAGVSEVKMAGALKQKPIKLVKCVTNDLLVPANSEIVLEGEIPPGEFKEEGPFGEYPGYYGGAIMPRPIIKVKCITHRNNPIHTGSLEGPPLVDDHIMGSISCSAIAKKHLEDAGLRGWVKDVFYPPFGASWHVCIVSGKKRHAGFAQRVAYIIWGTKLGTAFSDKVIFVDEDIDPTDLNQVIWAIATRMNPERDIHVIRRSYVSVLLPLTELPERELGIAGRLIIDAAFPYEWEGKEWKGMPQIPQKVSFEHWPEDARNKAEEIVKRYLSKNSKMM